MRNRHFLPGQSTFVCNTCGKRTRDTCGNGSLGMCELCLVKGEAENSLSDGGVLSDPWGVFDDCKTVEEVYDLQFKLENENAL